MCGAIDDGINDYTITICTWPNSINVFVSNFFTVKESLNMGIGIVTQSYPYMGIAKPSQGRRV